MTNVPTMTRSGLRLNLATVWRALLPSWDRSKPSENEQQELRANREFVLEMMDRHPEAFQSEVGLADLARLYRCKC